MISVNRETMPAAIGRRDPRIAIPRGNVFDMGLSTEGRVAGMGCVNDVTLIGEVTGIEDQRELTSISVKAKGLGIPVPVVFYDDPSRQFTREWLSSRLGSTVLVEAYIRTRKKLVGSQEHYYQDIVGIDLRMAPTRMEWAFGCIGMGTAIVKKENLVRLCGEVVNKYVIKHGNGAPICTQFTLKTALDNKLNFPSLIFYSGYAATETVQIGDWLMILGRIQVRKEIGESGKTWLTTDIVGTELQR